MADLKSELKSSFVGSKSIFERINVDVGRLTSKPAGIPISSQSHVAKRTVYDTGYSPTRRGGYSSSRNSRNAPFPSRSDPYYASNCYAGSSRKVMVESMPEMMMSERGRRGERDEWKHDRFEGCANAPASTVFVRGLQKNVSEQKLRSLFENPDYKVCMLKIERAPLTTAVIGFTRRDAAPKAVQSVHGRIFMGERVKVMEWERETNALQIRDQFRAQEAAENEQMRLELLSMQKDVDPERRLSLSARKHEMDDVENSRGNNLKRRQITMASMVPKQSVFDRVSG